MLGRSRCLVSGGVRAAVARLRPAGDRQARPAERRARAGRRRRRRRGSPRDGPGGRSRHGHRRLAWHDRPDMPARRGRSCRRRRPRDGWTGPRFLRRRFRCRALDLRRHPVPRRREGPGRDAPCRPTRRPRRGGDLDSARSLRAGGKPPRGNPRRRTRGHRRPRCRRSCASSSPRRSRRCLPTLASTMSRSKPSRPISRRHPPAGSPSVSGSRPEWRRGSRALARGARRRSTCSLPGWKKAQGLGPVNLGAMASIGLARVP